MYYSLWYNTPTMLPAGSLEAGTSLPGYRSATSWVHYTTSCNTQSSAPEDGRDKRPKHVELIGINKPLLLHLVGVYIIYTFLQSITLLETRAVYEIMLKSIVQPGMPQMTIQHIRFNVG